MFAQCDCNFSMYFIPSFGNSAINLLLIKVDMTRPFNKSHIKEGGFEINYIKIFHNAHALSVSVGNSYSEYQLMHTFLDNFQQGGKYSSQIANHQAELRREEKFTDKKSLKISSLKTDYLHLGSSSGFCRNSERAHAVQTECTFCGGNNHSAEQCFKKVRTENEKARAVDVSFYRQIQRTPRKFFRCGSEDHMIAKFPKQVCFIEKGNYACDNSKSDIDCETYEYMERMSSNEKCKIHCKTEN